MTEADRPESAVFLVTVRSDAAAKGRDATDSAGRLQGSVVIVTGVGTEPPAPRWFRALEHIPAILRALLHRHHPTLAKQERRKP